MSAFRDRRTAREKISAIVPAARRPRRRPRGLESDTVFLIGLSSAAIAACTKFGEDVFNHESAPFDEPIRAWALARQRPAVRDAFLVITRGAAPSVLIPSTAALGAWLWKRRSLPIAGAVVMSPAIALATEADGGRSVGGPVAALSAGVYERVRTDTRRAPRIRR